MIYINDSDSDGDVEMVDYDYTFNNIITTSDCTQLLDASIEDVKNKKKTMVSTMDSVISLMREVECVEKAAEQAKEEAARSCSDIISKVHELQQAQQQVKKTNDMLATEAYAQKELLATKMEVLQLQVQTSLDKGDISLGLLDEMRNSLEKRLTSAVLKKELANKRKQESEAACRAALAYEEILMKKVEEESKRLNQESVEISKLQEFLIDRGHVVFMLLGEISNKCQDVELLKEELDQAILPGGIMSSIIPGQPQPEQADSDVLFRTSSGLGLGDITDDHVRSANHKQIKFGESRPLIYEKAVLEARAIKSCDFGKNLGDAATREVKKLHENQMLATRIKKVKMNCKLHGSQMFAKSSKKVKIKNKLHGNQMSARRDKKVKIKSKLHGNQKSTKRIKKLKIKGKLYGNQVSANSIKKVKIKGGKLYGKHLSSKSIKIVKIKGNPHGNQMFVKCFKKVKIKGLRL